MVLTEADLSKQGNFEGIAEEFDFPERVPDFEKDEDIIRVKLDNAICTELRALHFLKIPRLATDHQNTALTWLNLSGVFSIIFNGRQVPCRFIVRGQSGEGISCVLDSGESFLLNTGVSADMQLCIFQPAVFDQLVVAAFQAQEAFAQRAEAQVKQNNKTRRSRDSEFILNTKRIDEYIPALDVTTMDELTAGLLLKRVFRQVITPSPEQPGSCTAFFEWLARQRKANKLTYAVRFEKGQVQIALVGVKLDGPLHRELTQEYIRTFTVTTTALFPSLAEASAIVENFFPNMIEETIGYKGRVQRSKLTFDDLQRFQQQIHNQRMPRIRLGQSVVGISDESREMVPTIYITF